LETATVATWLAVREAADAVVDALGDLIQCGSTAPVECGKLRLRLGEMVPEVRKSITSHIGCCPAAPSALYSSTKSAQR
jgi:hypothetical protein